MKYINYDSKYDTNPFIKIDGTAYSTYEDIVNILKNKENKTIAFECYPGTDYEVLKSQIISHLDIDRIIFIDDFSKDKEVINQMFEPYLTEDRVFGKMNNLCINDLYEEETLLQVNESITNGVTIVFGFGASLISHDLLVYVDIARWEIQQRYRNKTVGNWKIDNFEEDILRKYKRGYFIEWRIADKLKDSLFDSMDYYIDGNDVSQFKMMTGYLLRESLLQFTKQPFRLIPYFDTGVWGGQWMKEVCNLDKSVSNFAWSFDGVPEENSVGVKLDNALLQVPAINIVLYQPTALLGNNVFQKYGAEFPIRFDFLDTVEGQNLSLQVHPIKEYIKDQFNMKYTQDESYYFLDAMEGSNVYLGLKTGTEKDDFINALKEAQVTNQFDAEKYVNIIPVKKHDHVLIPAGTVHCSGSGTMVLEISATPYIFTFKLWDWNRLGLDGLPRPIHIEHGSEVIDFKRDTEYVHKNCYNNIEVLKEEKGIIEERTGLHPLEPIETRRYWFNDLIHLESKNTVNMLNLVEGEEIVVESINNEFEPFIIHYAETFIIPANISEYTIRPTKQSNKKYAILRAYIR